MGYCNHGMLNQYYLELDKKNTQKGTEEHSNLNKKKPTQKIKTARIKFLKKIFFTVLSVCFLIPNLVANPIDVRVFEISELYFHTDDEWTLELLFPFDIENHGLYIDSIYLHSSTAKSRVNFNTPIQEFDAIVIITKDSLYNDIFLKNSADSLIVEIFYNYEGNFSTIPRILIYGDKPGSMITNIKPSQSIAYIGIEMYEYTRRVYAKDNTPTLGFKNDTSGVCGYLYGTVFNLVNGKVKNTEFALDYSFTTNDLGQYKTSICSRYYDELSIYFDNLWQRSSFTPFNNDIEPQENYQFDIYLLDSVLMGIPIKTSNVVNKYKIFPNPTSGLFKVKGEFKPNTILRVANIEGKGVFEKSIEGNMSEIEVSLGSSIKSGIFIISIIEKNIEVYNQQIIVNSFK